MTNAKNKKKWTVGRILVTASPLFLLFLWVLTPGGASFKQPGAWQRMTEPGALSAAHTTLENHCAACHTSIKGVEPAGCIACHANNEALLQRQPTAFHADISRCAECHLEHQGLDQRPTGMNHEKLAEIGLRQLKDKTEDGEKQIWRKKIIAWSRGRASPHSNITALEATLNCFRCHGNDDRHFTLFGRDCAQCHATDSWTIPEFRHPSSRSRDCAQCHQGPPSHYMMHFKMISARVAGKPNARVDQCFECHQTTSWNDIKDAGWYKHH